ncbi:MAG: SDR family NAD(P)-dependent oxidoreductase [Verrucomicrobia bacterium]|nr:SDR family NAD(P)-dependent oxidoreductase [Verrucomicrobiota bacterium]
MKIHFGFRNRANIVSDAGKLASAKAGPGYVLSKFGLAGLTQCLNAEERGHGIRACAIFPGDVDTPLLNQRPQPPDAAARARMMRAEDMAGCALFCFNLPTTTFQRTSSSKKCLCVRAES